MASNGSLWTVPDFPQRRRELAARGGRLVVLDPRRTETAKVADEHHFVRPGLRRGRPARGRARAARRRASPARRPTSTASTGSATRCAVHARARRGRERDAGGCRARGSRRTSPRPPRPPSTGGWASRPRPTASSASGRSRRSTCSPATSTARAARCSRRRPSTSSAGACSSPGGFGRRRSRVRGLPGFGGELPVSALAEEITTPGEGQVRALLTIAGNPVSSTPGGQPARRGARRARRDGRDRLLRQRDDPARRRHPAAAPARSSATTTTSSSTCWPCATPRAGRRRSSRPAGRAAGLGDRPGPRRGAAPRPRRRPPGPVVARHAPGRGAPAAVSPAASSTRCCGRPAPGCPSPSSRG